MTAEPIQPAADPGRSPAAIRDVLQAADRAEFARSWAAALDGLATSPVGHHAQHDGGSRRG
jgi:hypothetical protein